ncbi:hypothetical protein HKBW3S09_02029, partial [Candidatus Hakubella thermalkaliphila]
MGLKIARDAIKSIGVDITVETSEGKTKFVYGCRIRIHDIYNRLLKSAKN